MKLYRPDQTTKCGDISRIYLAMHCKLATREWISTPDPSGPQVTASHARPRLRRILRGSKLRRECDDCRPGTRRVSLGTCIRSTSLRNFGSCPAPHNHGAQHPGRDQQWVATSRVKGDTSDDARMRAHLPLRPRAVHMRGKRAKQTAEFAAAKSIDARGVGVARKTQRVVLARTADPERGEGRAIAKFGRGTARAAEHPPSANTTNPSRPPQTAHVATAGPTTTAPVRPTFRASPWPMRQWRVNLCWARVASSAVMSCGGIRAR